jgi:hypothetical protein
MQIHEMINYNNQDTHALNQLKCSKLKKQAKGDNDKKSDGLENLKKYQREKEIEWYKEKEIRSLRMLKVAGYEGLQQYECA